MSNAAFDLTGLVNRIRSETLNFDQMVDSVKTKEENQIHNIELKERDVDRELDAVAEKYHFGHKYSNPGPGESFLERKHRHEDVPKYSHLKKVEPHEIVSEKDVKAMEKSELAREEAEKELVQVEANLADMPERLFHTKERRAKEDKDVPLEDTEEDFDTSIQA